MDREEMSGKSNFTRREWELKDEMVDDTREERIHRVQRARWKEGGGEGGREEGRRI